MPNPLHHAHVSVFAGIDASPRSTEPVWIILGRIQDGTYAQHIADLRALLASGKTAAYSRRKDRSVGFTPGGVFTHRANAQLTTPSGLLGFDFDHVPDVEAAQASLREDPWVSYAFRSPSGHGLKVGVWADGIVDDATYKYAWSTVLDYFARTYPAIAASNDHACKDIARLCYVSWDPDLYLNLGALMFAVPPPPVSVPPPEPAPPRQTTATGTDRRSQYADRARTTAAQMIASGIPARPDASGTRHAMQLRASRLLGGYVAGGVLTHAEARSALHAAVAQNTRDLDGDMHTIDDGLAYGASHPITLEDLEAERLAWVQAHVGPAPHRSTPPDVPDFTEPPLVAQDPLPDDDDDCPQESDPSPASGDPRTRRAVSIQMDTVEAREVDWLWYPYLALGKVSMLDGDPGTGKTMLVLQLAAILSQGWCFPDQHGTVSDQHGDPARSLFLCMEDDLGDTVKPRLLSAHANTSLITVVNEVEIAGRRVPFTLEHLDTLRPILERECPKLVIIDSIQMVIGGKADTRRANQVTEKLMPLAGLAREFHCAIVCLRHLSKPGQSTVKLLYRGMDSVAFIGTARGGLFVEEHPTDRTKALLMPQKSNNAAPAITQIFSKAEGVFTWAGVTRLTGQILVGSGHGPDAWAVLSAYLWLEHRLWSGHVFPATTIQDEMEAEGFKRNTIYEAKKRLGVVHTKNNDTGAYTWHLPPLPPCLPPTTTTSATSMTSTTSTTSITSNESMGYTDTESGQNPESLVSEVSEVSEVIEVPEVITVIASLETTLTGLNGQVVLFEGEPCYDCQQTTRWDDHGTARCHHCWPPALCVDDEA